MKGVTEVMLIFSNTGSVNQIINFGGFLASEFKFSNPFLGEYVSLLAP